MNSFGAALQQIRQTHRLRGYHIAALIGVSESTISRWEHNERRPRTAKPLRCLLHALSATEAEQQLLLDAYFGEPTAIINCSALRILQREQVQHIEKLLSELQTAQAALAKTNALILACADSV